MIKDAAREAHVRRAREGAQRGKERERDERGEGVRQEVPCDCAHGEERGKLPGDGDGEGEAHDDARPCRLAHAGASLGRRINRASARTKA